MTESYTKPNAALEKQIAECHSSEEIRDTLLRYQQINGMPNATDRVALPTISTWASSSSDAEETPKSNLPPLLRRDVKLDDGTVKTITGYSPSGLDILERELRGKRI